MDEHKTIEIRRLIEKLEKLEVPDRELDTQICLVMEYLGDERRTPVSIRKENTRLIYKIAGAELMHWEYEAPKLTASLDAVQEFTRRHIRAESISIIGNPLRGSWETRITLTVTILGKMQAKAIEFKANMETAARLGCLLRMIIQRSALEEHLRQK